MTDIQGIEHTIEAYFAALRARDTTAILATLAEDVTSQDPADNPELLRGHAAMQTFFEGAFETFAVLDIHARHIFVRGNEATVYFTADADTHGSDHIVFDGIDLMTFNTEGKIQSLRAFWYPEFAMAPLQGPND